MARADDLDNLARLLDEVVLLHHDEDPTQFLGPEAAAHHRYLEERFQDPDAAIFVADDKGTPAGVAVTVIREAPPFLNPNIWARARDMKELDLNVYEFNHTAIHFYEALGFRTVSRRMKRSLPPLVETKD